MFGIIVAILSILAFVFFTFRKQSACSCSRGKEEGVLPQSSKLVSCESCRSGRECNRIHCDEVNNLTKSFPILVVAVCCLAFFSGCQKKTLEDVPVQTEVEETITDPYEIHEEKGFSVLTDTNFFVAVKNNDLLLVDCWMDYCPPCVEQAKILAPLVDSYQGQVKFAKYHHDSNGRRSLDYGIQMFPTLLLFKDGKLKEVLVGFYPERNLRKILDAEINSAIPPVDEPAPE